MLNRLPSLCPLLGLRKTIRAEELFLIWREGFGGEKPARLDRGQGGEAAMRCSLHPPRVQGGAGSPRMHRLSGSTLRSSS